jgi:hypothetical protein
MKLTRTLVCSLALLALANTASATVIFYTDRTSFQNAITAGLTVDFESPFPFESTAITFGDATFVSTDGSGLHRTDAGSFGNPTTTLSAQNFGGIRIELASGHFAIGLDVGELLGSTDGQFALTGSSSALLDSRATTVGYFGNNPSFVGWISTEEIGSLQFLINGQDVFEAIDNVILDEAGPVGPANGVPAPATVVLFSLGLAGIGFARRVRARQSGRT